MSGSPFPGGSDDAVIAIRGHAGVLGTALAIWSARDDARPCPEARHAANDAVDAIDAMLAELHRLRARLISDSRASDDARAQAIDALLAGRARDQELPGASRPLDAEGRALERPARERNTDE